jgi:hypothetical protein
LSVSYVKFCPRCQATTSVETPVCAKCGHQFRTQFDPPVSEKTIAMTAATPSGVTPQASRSQRNGYAHKATGRSAAFRRPRLRPRRLLILVGTILAVAALYGGYQLAHGRDLVAPGDSVIVRPVFQPYEVVFKDAPQGQPSPLAPHDPRDLLRWQMTAKPSTPNNANSTDDPARVHLYLSGQIALISSGTQARVLQDQGEWPHVQILSGRHQGLTGYINRSDINRFSPKG